MVNKITKALNKYIDNNDYTYDFQDARSNIKMTMEHLKIEIEEHDQRERQTPWLLTLFGALVAYLPKLISFIMSTYSSKLDVFIFMIYFICLSVCIFCLIKFMWPRNRIQLENPRKFYNDLLEKYKADNEDKELINKYIQHSYLSHLCDCLDSFKTCNLIKSTWRFYTLISMIICVLPYLLCISTEIIK
jgi:hypothetical protein